MSVFCTIFCCCFDKSLVSDDHVRAILCIFPRLTPIRTDDGASVYAAKCTVLDLAALYFVDKPVTRLFVFLGPPRKLLAKLFIVNEYSNAA